MLLLFVLFHFQYLIYIEKKVKVGDFGLSRAIGSHSDYYRASEGGRWPVKWFVFNVLILLLST